MKVLLITLLTFLAYVANAQKESIEKSTEPLTQGWILGLDLSRVVMPKYFAASSGVIIGYHFKKHQLTGSFGYTSRAGNPDKWTEPRDPRYEFELYGTFNANRINTSFVYQYTLFKHNQIYLNSYVSFAYQRLQDKGSTIISRGLDGTLTSEINHKDRSYSLLLGPSIQLQLRGIDLEVYSGVETRLTNTSITTNRPTRTPPLFEDYKELTFLTRGRWLTGFRITTKL